jgi:hypothetical protein
MSYIIDRFLKIHHSHGVCYVELEQIISSNEADSAAYDTDLVIYVNGAFISDEFRDKYLHHIQEKVGMRVRNTRAKYPDIFTLRSMDDINMVIQFNNIYTKDNTPMYHYMYFEDSQDDDSDDHF